MEEFTNAETVEEIKKKIYLNNKIIASASKENERLFRSLMIRMTNDPNDDQKARYATELASDNWKYYYDLRQEEKNKPFTNKKLQ